MKLLKSHRELITKRLIAKVCAAREPALRARSHALAVRLLKHRYGDDVFDRCRALPEGWLNRMKTIPIYGKLSGTYSELGWLCEVPSVSLTEYALVPNSARLFWKDEEIGSLTDEVAALYATFHELNKELHQLRQQIRATLAAFTTVEKLAADWPEGYVELPAETLTAPAHPVPALRIADLNARLAAAREAA